MIKLIIFFQKKYIIKNFINRYPVDKKRAIFMFRDGSQSVDAKNYLIEQPECSHVTLEGHTHIGRYAPEVKIMLYTNYKILSRYL